jgi:hypothetical protein
MDMKDAWWFPRSDVASVDFRRSSMSRWYGNVRDTWKEDEWR